MLVVNEIFKTIEGEGTRAGRLCTLLRLTGCNLRCRWCDTKYAYEEGRRMSLEEALAEVSRIGCKCVMVTGGEPLLQPAAPELLRRLCEAGHEVLVQTNGSQDVSGLDERVVRCVDVKCPGSGQAGSLLRSNLDCLRPQDEVNFVLANEDDYRYAQEMILAYDLASRATVFLTAASGLLEPAALADWMLADAALPAGVRLGLQLHKIVWPKARRGV